MFRKATSFLLPLLIVLTLLGSGHFTARTTATFDSLTAQPDASVGQMAVWDGERQSQAGNAIADLVKSRVSRNPKLDSVLADLTVTAQTSVKEALDVAQSQSLRLSGDQVHVQIVTHALGLEKAVRAITQAGGQVTGVGYDDTLIQGWLPVAALETVAAQEDVYYIRRPAEAVLLEDSDTDDSTTEGLAVINGLAWHTAGYTGAGVKIGVIDGGFLGYTSLLGADLPAVVTVKNFVDGEDDSQVDGTSAHGTACAEIIHDIAPDATLYLAKITTNLDLAEAVAWLKDTHQVDIISTSLGWYNLTPGDGSGEFADLVQLARNAGILWVTAAGNDREAHWGGPYSDPDLDDIHNFNGTKWVNCFGPGDGSCYSIVSGIPINVFVRWDDWTNVDQDYNLYLLRWNGADWDIIASGENVQDGSAGQCPAEYVAATTSGADTAYGFAIMRVSSTRAVNFEIFAPKVARLDELLHARSLGNLADAPDAMTVAALDVTSPYPQEPYSSEGPTNGPGGTEMGGFVKPDIAAFANVATESYPGSTFKGTSAATPHVAGAAALVLDANPGYTPDDVQSFLEGRAVGMGSAGKDTLFGSGRLYLGEAPQVEPQVIYLPLVMNNYDASELLQNGDFDTGTWTPWETSGSPELDDQVYHLASPSARLGGRNDAVDYVVQEVTVPSNATEVTLDYWDRISGNDPDPDEVLCVEILDSGLSTILAGYCLPLYELTQDQWLNGQIVISGADLTPLLGQTVFVAFDVFTNATNPSTVWVDDVSFKVTGIAP